MSLWDTHSLAARPPTARGLSSISRAGGRITVYLQHRVARTVSDVRPVSLGDAAKRVTVLGCYPFWTLSALAVEGFSLTNADGPQLLHQDRFRHAQPLQPSSPWSC